MDLPYNEEDKNSILEYAQRLKGKTLRQVCNTDIIEHNYSGKGHFGQILEKYYFFYEPNSNSEPDFPIAGVELKSSPLKKAQKGRFSSKERLVLNIINYLDIVNQDFETSAFWKKNAYLLLVFYLHEADKNSIDYIIKLAEGWDYPNTDLEIIKKDWEFIKKKVADGKAHELSEGDTFYLGACTKGGKGGNPRKQPNNDILAKQRAFSLKQGYVNHIIASITTDTAGIYGKLISSEKEVKKKTIEEIVVSKFQPYYGKTVDEIITSLRLKLNVKAKSFCANLTKAMFGIELNKEIEEFEKAEIIVKTVRLKENNLPKEDMSFRPFKYEELACEEWEDSDFKVILDHKFFFVFFQLVDNQLVLRKVKFWNMPFQDIEEAKKVWLKTKGIVINGNIVREIKGKERHTNFPNKKFNSVSHVRPHAQNANDTYPLPFTDKVTNTNEYTKHCFWLNSAYIRDEIYLKS
jgi:DNA mismatch repair protein MutH